MSGVGARFAVVGATGGIGAALCAALERRGASVRRFSRTGAGGTVLDYDEPASIEAAAGSLDAPLDGLIVATGLLRGEGAEPEKSLRDLDGERLARAFHVNAVGPALVLRHFLPRMGRDGVSRAAVVTAKVGSIEDNRLGGWYGYRAAKAAANQIVRTAAIEHARRWPDGIVVALHPGTVDTDLSRPFQRSANTLFAPDEAAVRMLDVLDGLTPADTGGFFSHDGTRLPF